jgi:hypothetical protein
MINFVSNCKGIAGRKQNCQGYAGRRTKNCKVFLGRDNSSLITHHSSLITHHSSPITHHSSLITHNSFRQQIYPPPATDTDQFAKNKAPLENYPETPLPRASIRRIFASTNIRF